MRRLSFLWFVLTLLAIAPVAAFAQSPGTLSYQGVLTDDDGIIVPDGNYSLTFRIYDEFGGALYTETQPAVPVERGGFSVVLGLGVGGIAIPFDRTYFLGIRVGADPELTPRVRLTASPYSMGLRLPFVQSAASSNPLLDLNNTGTGPEAWFRERIDVGGGSNGVIRVLGIGETDSQVEITTSFLGGSIVAKNDDNDPYAFLQPDPSGLGGSLLIMRNAVNAGFNVDGNFVGGDPRVVISGAGRSASFDMSQAGSGSVNLPVDAISANETLDEPGVASAIASTTITLDGTVQTLTSRTLTVPAAGYCLVMASAQANLIHVVGAATSVIFGVSDVTNGLPVNQDILLQAPSTAASGSYAHGITAHGLFQVSAGANTFYILAEETSGDVSVADVQLSILYVPTAYGTVTSTLTTGGGDELARGAAVTPAEIATEQAEAVRFDRERIDGEMRAMRAHVDELRRQLDAVVAEQRAARGEQARP